MGCCYDRFLFGDASWAEAGTVTLCSAIYLAVTASNPKPPFTKPATFPLVLQSCMLEQVSRITTRVEREALAAAVGSHATLRDCLSACDQNTGLKVGETTILMFSRSIVRGGLGGLEERLPLLRGERTWLNYVSILIVCGNRIERQQIGILQMKSPSVQGTTLLLQEKNKGSTLEVESY